jgi:hypothetical protein
MNFWVNIKKIYSPYYDIRVTVSFQFLKNLRFGHSF